MDLLEEYFLLRLDMALVNLEQLLHFLHHHLIHQHHPQLKELEYQHHFRQHHLLLK